MKGHREPRIPLPNGVPASIAHRIATHTHTHTHTHGLSCVCNSTASCWLHSLLCVVRSHIQLTRHNTLHIAPAVQHHELRSLISHATVHGVAHTCTVYGMLWRCHRFPAPTAINSKDRLPKGELCAVWYKLI